ncbi:YtpI family protein [Paenisporosarcina cavernae]|uniref:YtpI-like protein n=1 Tax=Paenisporosarcina cavernae TaxID=2320858 RepID=A0A385YTK3_9BACL|nr:YtpI family protein [Paenisporosarcina cavernae]AYC29841.1 hypothetical protein D3873_08000 [Paenisporosarcina cavernae]
MVNLFLVIGIVISAVFYLYFKTKQFRSSLPITKKWYANRALISLGSLLVFFGINQMILYPSTLTYVIGALFILLGIGTVGYYWKVAKHYGQFVKEEQAINTSN